MVDRTFVHIVQVQLPGANALSVERLQIRREVTRIPQPMRDRPHPLRQPKPILPMRPHRMRVRGRLIHSHEESRPARRTGRIRRKHPRIPHPFRGQAVQVRRMHPLRPIAPQIVRKILPDQPKYIRPAPRRLSMG